MNTQYCLGVTRSLKDIGWLSVDLAGAPDVQCDFAHLTLPEPASVLVASHVLEHIPQRGRGEDRVRRTIEILTCWHSQMQPDAALIVCVPDGDLVTRLMIERPHNYWSLSNTEFRDILGLIYGGNQDDLNRHYMLFNQSCLSWCLAQAGFIEIERIPPERDLWPGLPRTLNTAAHDLRSLNLVAFVA
ncbi:MAG: hypothetical protein WC683_14090 [bacterium]|jgi:predicted SAM-dependent methyltransferase